MHRIAGEPGGPEDPLRQYQPTTWPGARLPHVWLEGHQPIQDRIGSGYTLLRLGGSREEIHPFKNAMRAPFEVLDVPDVVARDLYGFDLILLRPDMHIAWRGNRMPEDPQHLAAMITGH